VHVDAASSQVPPQKKEPLSLHEVLAKQSNPFGHSLERPDGHGCRHDEDASSKDVPQKYDSGGTIGIGASVGVSTAFDPSSLHRVYAKHPRPLGQVLLCPVGQGMPHVDVASSKDDPQKNDSVSSHGVEGKQN